ncbi:ATP-binding protein [Hymenobacter sp. 5516J-16]|uniref:sensor histidine kinase n=1 Tax=Hymenobacter sp. 5516J-16 TaxID=2932253 RepID=UPI001FD1661E|nr:ATP-binding protein [Hymenobacter sp. 5516J-16]UOQ78246.1 ATP-binding protein [Hymenobacter sp. 5516J-16]
MHYNRGHLRTILLNLLSNALRYRHPDRPPRVRVRGWRGPTGQAMLSVADNGLGIDLSRHGADLFQLFRRFHPEAAEGTGVGLFLVNRIVESNGGELQVESTVGEGSTFRVTLN